jgi:hypothetical protein
MVTALNKTAAEIASEISDAADTILNTTTRDNLNNYSHIVDISYNALKINQLYDDSAAFITSYKKFIEAIAAANVKTFRSYKDPDFAIGRGITYVDGGQWNTTKKYLIASSYSAVRTFITKISQSQNLAEDKYFGLVYRARTLDEYLALGSTEESLRLSGKIFNAAGQQVENGVVKYQNLSALDIGHTYKKNSNSRITPLSEKFTGLLQIPGLSGRVKLDITKALTELSRVHLEGDISFHNTIPDSFSKKNAGFIVVTLHSFKKNKQFAKDESKLYSRIKKLVYKSYPDVAKQAGSNSFNQDIVEKVTLDILGNFAKNRVKLAAHKKVSSKISVNSTAKVSVGQTGMELPKKKTDSKPSANTTAKYLTSLQTLLSSQLQDVISANMGDGSQRSILNYRTGRFASTVKVEKLSQARSGMITAFYSYMKNPYATFSEGGRQQYPRSRDPKLLISRSIRDIGKNLAINQMRAVSI